MAEYRFSTHICVSQQEIEATESDVLILLEGLGVNILKHLGNVQLGKAIRVSMRDEGGRVVGGTTANIKYFKKKRLVW